MRKKSLLVLVGGFGFVGRNILENLTTNKAFSEFVPVVIDDLSNACPCYEKVGVNYYAGTYQSKGAQDFLDRFEADYDSRVFVFLAGETRVAESRERPLDFIQANIAQPSQFVTDTIKQSDKFILISTAGALFDGTFEVSVNSPYCPKNFYGATKAAEEMILGKLVEMQGGEFRVVRFTNVFGRFSDKKKSAIHAFTRAILKDQSVTINGDGKQSRDFIFASDVGFGVAELARRMREGSADHEVYMLGSGQSVTLWDVVEALEGVTGRTLAYQQNAATELLQTEPRDVVASQEDVRVLLEGHLTDFSEGIRQTSQYYLSLQSAEK